MDWGLITRGTGPLSYVFQIGDQISSKHASQLPNRAHHQDLSEQRIDRLFDDVTIQPEPEQTIQPDSERLVKGTVPELNKHDLAPDVVAAHES